MAERRKQRSLDDPLISVALELAPRTRPQLHKGTSATPICRSPFSERLFALHTSPK